MELVLTIFLFASILFEPSLEQAFQFIESGDWAGAASALDQAVMENPDVFAANNLHYLRGHLAANQEDWIRAQAEFAKISQENPLYTLALWHRARAAVRLGDDEGADLLLNQLPRDFPTELRMQIARSAGETLALKIYQGLQTREARFERASMRNDRPALWVLIRENRNDEIALRGADRVAPSASTARQHKDLGDVFIAHRQFSQALSHYESAARDPVLAAEARFQIGRVHFLSERYQVALETYQQVARTFPGTDWEKDARYQIASCYWRLGEYRRAERAYLDYIAQYSGARVDEGAVRNLVDVYRVLGDNQKAIELIDRTLARRVTAGARQVFLFTKAKILYIEQKYAPALQIFQQLGRMRLTSNPNGTTAEEVRYFQAMCYSRLGNESVANSILRGLASESSYYGQKAAAKLGTQSDLSATGVCTANVNTVLNSVQSTLIASRRPLRSVPDPLATTVSELSYLRLWDEAAFWSDRAGSRPDNRTAAELAYVAGRFHRSIVYADRLPETESARPALLYPAGFRQLICDAAQTYNVDPLWLHAIIWQESKYNPSAISGASARGLMQFIPETARTIAAAIGVPNLTLDRLYEPALSIQMGAHYWFSLMQELKSPEMALAAYNGGIDNVRRWRNKWPGGDGEFFVSDIGFTETKNYVMAVFAARAAYSSLSQER
jgi:soluble lytic murein transglycosylase